MSFVPDENGNIEIELWGGPFDGARVETAAPTGEFFITYEGQSRYGWDGETVLEKLIYIDEVEDQSEEWESDEEIEDETYWVGTVYADASMFDTDDED